MVASKQNIKLKLYSNVFRCRWVVWIIFHSYYGQRIEWGIGFFLSIYSTDSIQRGFLFSQRSLNKSNPRYSIPMRTHNMNQNRFILLPPHSINSKMFACPLHCKWKNIRKNDDGFPHWPCQQKAMIWKNTRHTCEWTYWLFFYLIQYRPFHGQNYRKKE